VLGLLIPLIHLEPQVPHPAFLRKRQTGLSQRVGNSLAAVIRMDGNIGNQVRLAGLSQHRNKVNIAHDLTIFYPDKALDARREIAEPLVTAAAAARLAHLPDKPPAVSIQGGRKAQFDQVRHRLQVLRQPDRPQVRAACFYRVQVLNICSHKGILSYSICKGFFYFF
jgi:hypothetical protein